jgi:hypothetical protein
VLVTSFGVRVVAQGQSVQFVEGLANYATFDCSWKPYTGDGAEAAGSSVGAASSADANGKGSDSGLVEIRLDHYQSVDASTGEQTAVNTCPKLFIVDRSTGAFVRVLNVDELVDEAVALAVVAAGADKTAAQKEELRRLLLQQRDVMIRGVIDDIALMWRCFVEMWTHEEEQGTLTHANGCGTDSCGDAFGLTAAESAVLIRVICSLPVSVWLLLSAGATETIWGTKCTRRKRLVQSDQADNKMVLERFYDDLFQNVSQTNKRSRQRIG